MKYCNYFINLSGKYLILLAFCTILSILVITLYVNEVKCELKSCIFASKLKKTHIMKNLKFFAVALFVMGMIAASCEGPEGPRGPAGTSGSNGTDGNANVSVYGFPSDTLTSAVYWVYHTLPITGGLLDSSMIVSYYSNGVGWYQVGELGPGALYQTRYWLYGYTASSEIGIGVANSDGSLYTGSDIVWDSLRVFVIPANQFYAAEPEVNFSNYYEVESYFDQK